MIINIHSWEDIKASTLVYWHSELCVRTILMNCVFYNYPLKNDRSATSSYSVFYTGEIFKKIHKN